MKKTLSIFIAGLFVLVSCAKPTKSPGSGPVVVGGGAVAGSCVETYSPEHLKNRQIAFDGVVKQISSTKVSPEGAPEGETETRSEVLFTVNHWFKGGTKAEQRVASSVPIGQGVVSSVDSPDIKEGKRYLVSGDGGFMWSCGFTRDYSASDAAIWTEAFDHTP